MSNRITKAVEKKNSDMENGRVTNFMGNDSFAPDPITRLKIAAASSIFGEPRYYRDGMDRKGYLKRSLPDWLIPMLTDDGGYAVGDTSAYMEKLIDAALDYDFGATLELAGELRKDYLARLNPQVIMVRAAMHPGRARFNRDNPGLFRNIESKVMSRADEPAVQASYYLFANDGKKNGIPSILKRSWADRLEKSTRYEIAKYKNSEIGMIDTVRLCHANSEYLNELMSTGTLETDDEEKTWENLRSRGRSWKEIVSVTKIPHMALLRNLRGIASELEDDAGDRRFFSGILEELEKGVITGKQYPFRYYAAYMACKESDCNFKPLIMASLKRCMNAAVRNMPVLKGKVMVLSDNSGSAWGAIPSEYGKVTVAEIDNLSAIITAMRSEEGYVGIFGDRLVRVPVDSESDVFETLGKINAIGTGIGFATETGVWTFFREAVEKKEHWHTVFIYSDMQAGYSQLYSTKRTDCSGFIKRKGLSVKGSKDMINVMQLVEIYRRDIFRDMNVFAVQTAGYDNTVLPKSMYRTAILTGWTGKEAIYADRMIRIWDEPSSRDRI